MPSPIDKPIFGKIPALRLSILFLLGILIAHWSHLSFVLALPVLLVLLVAALLVRRVRDCILLLVMVMAGTFSYGVRKPTIPLITRFSNKWVRVYGVICNEPQKIGKDLRFELRIERLYNDGVTHEMRGKILVRSDAIELDYGHKIGVTGILLLPHSKKNPGEFDYRAYLARRGIYCTLNAAPGSITSFSSGSNGNPFMKRVVLPLRRFVRRSYSKTLSGESRAFVEGITLGEKERLSATTRKLFARTGIYHILAVSGLHVGIVGFIIFTLLGTLRIPRNLITPIVIGILIIYAFVTNLKPSVVRATIMMGTLLLGYATERNVSLLNLLGVALLIILLFDPSSPFDLSFQLSFVATGSIILVLSKFRITRGTFLHKWLHFPIVISLAAQAGTAPIVAYHFFRLPLLTTVANLLVIPSVTLSIALGFVSSLSSLVSLEAARMLAAANWLIIQFVLKLVGVFGSFRYAEVVTGRPSPQFLLAYFLIFSLVLYMNRVWVRKVLIFTILVVANLFLWQNVFASVPLRTTFLSVAGSACIVETPNHKTILIDCGEGMNSIERVIAPVLWEKGIRRIDVLLLTRPESSEGIPFLFQNFEIGLLVAPPVPSGSQEYIRALQLLQKHNCDYVGAMRGDKIFLDEVRLVFHYPTSDLTEFASVFELNYRDVSLLWWGDGVHGASKLNFHTSYDIAKFDSPVHPEVKADVAVYESQPDMLTDLIDNLLFTKHGAVSGFSDGDTFRVEQVSPRPNRVNQ